MSTNFRSFLIRYRREISACFAAIGVLLLISVIRSATPTIYALVATKTLPAGHKISSTDLGTIKIPKSLSWPTLISDLSLIEGKIASHSISIGQPLSNSDLISSDLLSGFTSSQIAISIPVSTNQISAYLTPGNYINVYAAESGAPAVLVAYKAVVLFVPTAKSGAFQIQSTETSLILAVDPGESAAIASYVGNGNFSFALLPNK